MVLRAQWSDADLVAPVADELAAAGLALTTLTPLRKKNGRLRPVGVRGEQREEGLGHLVGVS